MENTVFSKKEQPSNSKAASKTGYLNELPDHLKKYHTKETIPQHFREMASLPPKMSVSDDRTLATKVVNQSYERQKKIDQKRATENAIQTVANITATPAVAGIDDANDTEMKNDDQNDKQDEEVAAKRGDEGEEIIDTMTAKIEVGNGEKREEGQNDT